MIHSGRACARTASSGTTMTGSLEGKLLYLDVVVGISPGIIPWCLGETTSSSVDIVGGEIWLVEALASAGPSVSVIPAIGTEGGEEGVDKVADGQRGTEVECEDVVWC